MSERLLPREHGAIRSASTVLVGSRPLHLIVPSAGRLTHSKYAYDRGKVTGSRLPVSKYLSSMTWAY
jgi:hypothetical protein